MPSGAPSRQSASPRRRARSCDSVGDIPRQEPLKPVAEVEGNVKDRFNDFAQEARHSLRLRHRRCLQHRGGLGERRVGLGNRPPPVLVAKLPKIHVPHIRSEYPMPAMRRNKAASFYDKRLNRPWKAPNVHRERGTQILRTPLSTVRCEPARFDLGGLIEVSYFARIISKSASWNGRYPRKSVLFRGVRAKYIRKTENQSSAALFSSCP